MNYLYRLACAMVIIKTSLRHCSEVILLSYLQDAAAVPVGMSKRSTNLYKAYRLMWHKKPDW
jgi:hypothetical protein